jgi:hypothetical protein
MDIFKSKQLYKVCFMIIILKLYDDDDDDDDDMPYKLTYRTYNT